MNNTRRPSSYAQETVRDYGILRLLQKDDDFPEGFRNRSGRRFGWVSTGCGQRNGPLCSGERQRETAA